MARKDVQPDIKEPPSSDTKPFETALRIGQVFAAWAQVVGVLFAAMAAIYAINNNLLSIKNSELERSNSDLIERNVGLTREIEAREAKLIKLKKEYDDLGAASQLAKAEADRLKAIAKDSESAARSSRALLENAYYAAVSDQIALQATFDALRRQAEPAGDSEGPDTEGIFFNTKVPRESTLTVPDYVEKYKAILDQIRDNPATLGLETESEVFNNVIDRMYGDFQEHQSLLVCESPNVNKWLDAFAREIDRASRMMDLAEEAKLNSYAKANKWTEKQKEHAKEADWWKKERDRYRERGRESWNVSVAGHYYEAWWSALESCTHNFVKLPKIAKGELPPRTARDFELLPPEPMPEQKW